MGGLKKALNVGHAGSNQGETGGGKISVGAELETVGHNGGPANGSDTRDNEVPRLGPIAPEDALGIVMRDE